MKKLILSLILTTAIFSCSNREDDPQPEKQDFTSVSFIQTTLQGEWKGIASSSNGKQWQTLEGQFNVGYKTTYKFSGNTFKFRPFVQDQFAEEYPGTFSITPVVGNSNAVLFLDYPNGSVYGDKPLTLLDFSNGVITFVEPDSSYPENVRYYQFKKL